jgi:hypothetical protein
MVITLLACCVLMGFVAGDSMLSWRHLFRQINGESAEDLPVPLSPRVMLPIYVLMTALFIIGTRQAGI